ncbi:hypothetical protein SBRY_100208 [Actinacidiphila bryophytorum]|uniref:Uncharacterized protein n=1 Tax=Actinacidiphila bryophytorum TaxID=1436133 RepID=A0A9W4ED27_9ACTN|nr:hypothetical protein SBRY_100208 [Actinacidiphila bryophytorum]
MSATGLPDPAEGPDGSRPQRAPRHTVQAGAHRDGSTQKREHTERGSPWPAHERRRPGCTRCSPTVKPCSSGPRCRATTRGSCGCTTTCPPRTADCGSSAPAAVPGTRPPTGCSRHHGEGTARWSPSMATGSSVSRSTRSPPAARSRRSRRPSPTTSTSAGSARCSSNTSATRPGRQAGITAFTADTLASNHLMQRLIADLGLAAQCRHEDDEVHITIALTPDEEYLSAIDQRGRTADIASLAPLKSSAAPVGAGLRPAQLVEADLNPVVARPEAVLSVDVRIRVAPRQAYDPYLRRLRRRKDPPGDGHAPRHVVRYSSVERRYLVRTPTCRSSGRAPTFTVTPTFDDTRGGRHGASRRCGLGGSPMALPPPTGRPRKPAVRPRAASAARVAIGSPSRNSRPSSGAIRAYVPVEISIISPSSRVICRHGTGCSGAATTTAPARMDGAVFRARNPPVSLL